MGDKNIIELNGKRYDSLTGALVHAPKNIAKQVTHKTGKSIDSVISKSSKSFTGYKTKSSGNRKLNSRMGHKPQRAKTLMRTAVKKPTLKNKTNSSLKPSSSQLPSKLSATLPAAARTMVSERRLALSRHVNKSRLVSHFKPIDTTVTKHIKPIEVKKPSPQTVKQLGSESRRPKPKDDIFTIGLETATSHQQKLAPAKDTKRSKHHRLWRNLSIIFATVVVIAIGGIFVQKNLAPIELRIAADRSGVHATMPSYLPAGYKASTPIKYATDTVTISFTTSDNLSFSLIEQNSDWDSQTLRDSFVSVTNPSYNILQDQGRTIYVYSLGGATWVNNGIWYQISSGSGLSNNQILKISTSL